MFSSIDGSYPVRADLVADLMQKKGYSIPKLAGCAEIDRKSLYRLFRGEPKRMSTIEPIAKCLGVKPSALIDNPTPDPSPSEPVQTNVPSPVRLRINFELDIPFQQFKEPDDVIALLAKLREDIKQTGMLVIDTLKPGSVKVSCLASDPADVSRFFAAYLEGRFESLKLRNPQVLALDPSDDDFSPDSVEAASDTGSQSTDELASAQQNTDLPQSTPQSNINLSPLSRDQLAQQTSDPSQVKSIATGAAAGAAIGSVVPGLGTIVGGVIGGMLGALASQKTESPTHPQSATPIENPPQSQTTEPTDDKGQHRS